MLSVAVVQLDRIWPSEGCDVGSSPAGGTNPTDIMKERAVGRAFLLLKDILRWHFPLK